MSRGWGAGLRRFGAPSSSGFMHRGNFLHQPPCRPLPHLATCRPGSGRAGGSEPGAAGALARQVHSGAVRRGGAALHVAAGLGRGGAPAGGAGAAGCGAGPVGGLRARRAQVRCWDGMGLSADWLASSSRPRPVRFSHRPSPNLPPAPSSLAAAPHQSTGRLTWLQRAGSAAARCCALRSRPTWCRPWSGWRPCRWAAAAPSRCWPASKASDRSRLGSVALPPTSAHSPAAALHSAWWREERGWRVRFNSSHEELTWQTSPGSVPQCAGGAARHARPVRLNCSSLRCLLCC